ncbi:unnamed protein product [Absidia cylindrospora]
MLKAGSTAFGGWNGLMASVVYGIGVYRKVGFSTTECLIDANQGYCGIANQLY